MRKYLYSFAVFLFSCFVLNSFQLNGLSNLVLRSFNNSCLSFSDKMTTRTQNIVSLIVKIILLEPELTLSTPAAAKTQVFVHLSFN